MLIDFTLAVSTGCVWESVMMFLDVEFFEHKKSPSKTQHHKLNIKNTPKSLNFCSVTIYKHSLWLTHTLSHSRIHSFSFTHAHSHTLSVQTASVQSIMSTSKTPKPSTFCSLTLWRTLADSHTHLLIHNYTLTHIRYRRQVSNPLSQHEKHQNHPHSAL